MGWRRQAELVARRDRRVRRERAGLAGLAGPAALAEPLDLFAFQSANLQKARAVSTKRALSATATCALRSEACSKDRGRTAERSSVLLQRQEARPYRPAQPDRLALPDRLERVEPREPAEPPEPRARLELQAPRVASARTLPASQAMGVTKTRTATPSFAQKMCASVLHWERVPPERAASTRPVSCAIALHARLAGENSKA